MIVCSYCNPDLISENQDWCQCKYSCPFTQWAKHWSFEFSFLKLGLIKFNLLLILPSAPLIILPQNLPIPLDVLKPQDGLCEHLPAPKSPVNFKPELKGINENSTFLVVFVQYAIYTLAWRISNFLFLIF